MPTMRGVWIAGVVALAVAMTGVAAANQPPQAEAGLDQEAVVNQTVYLDAGGSLDPDGRIVEYDWSIETPGGNTTTPDCPSCSLTHFVPRENGTYSVTVTVTDDDGGSISDTMYVFVSASSAPGNSNNSSNTTAVVRSPQPTVGRVGAVGGTGADLDAVAGEYGGGMYLVNSNGGDFKFHTKTGREVTIPESMFEQMAGEDGRVSWEQAKHQFRQEGVTKDDIKESMHEGGSCGGFTCTAMSETSGEPTSITDASESDVGADVDSSNLDIGSIDLGPSNVDPDTTGVDVSGIGPIHVTP